MHRSAHKLFTLAAVVVAAISTHAFADSLGVAQNYNAFIFGDMTQSSDSQGALAVGGNFTATSYSVASSLPTTGTHLVVGGNLLTNSGGTINGTAYVGGNTTLNYTTVTQNLYTGGNFSGSGFANGTVYYGGSYSGPNWGPNNPGRSHVSSVTLPVDFNAAKTALTNLSTSLAALPTTGSFTDAYNALKLTGSVVGQNVFSISASILASATSISITLPAGAFAVVNILPVAGSTTISLPNVGFTYDATAVLWNLPDFTKITMSSFKGSILAPNAAVKFSSGNLDGTLVASSLSGGGELHNYTFTHDFTLLPPDDGGDNNPSTTPPAAPLPSIPLTGLLLLSAVGAHRLFLTRHRQSTPN